MTDVHQSAARGYQQNAQTYVTGRPDYPVEVIDWLKTAVGLASGKTAIDLGAGTGKLIPFLRQTGTAVVAVEPVSTMLEQLRAAHPEIEALAGNAAAIPVPSGSVEAVVCAQAFHWFATAEAVAEIHRVLRPGGMLALIWNGRDLSVPWVAKLGQITDAYEGDTPRYQTGKWREAMNTKLFTLVDERSFRNEHVGPAESVIVDRTMSVSFIGALPATEKAEIRRSLDVLIANTPELKGEPVSFPYLTSCFAYRRV